MPEWTERRLLELAATLTPNEYNAELTDRHYGATGPLEPRSCRCESPGLSFDPDEGEVRCWKCGAEPAGRD